jgi:hypothetical protein
VITPQGELPADADVEEGFGRIVVDFGGVDGEGGPAGLEVTALDGTRDFWEFPPDPPDGDDTPDELVFRQDVRPGEYLPFWYRAGRLGRWGALVLVEAGRETRVHVDDAQVFELPTPAGLGRVDVTVRSSGGFPLPEAPVSLRGSMAVGMDDFIERGTNGAGRAWFECLPGTHAIEVGGRSVPVTVRAGERVEMDVRPVAEGELLFDLQPCSAAPNLAGDVGGFYYSGELGGREVNGWFYVPAGRHELRWDKTTFGAATVHAGRATTFEGPPGGIVATLDDEATAHPLLTVERLDGEAWSAFYTMSMVLRDDDCILRLPYISAGTYRVHAVLGDRTTDLVVVEVGDRWADVRLSFPSER